MKIHKEIKSIRLKMGWKLKEMAGFLGITVSQYAKYESPPRPLGYGVIPKAHIWEKIKSLTS